MSAYRATAIRATLLLASLAVPALAVAEPVTTIRANGPSGNRVDLVIMGDGFTAAQIAFGTYRAAVETFVDAVFAQEPYKEYTRAFNVHLVDVVSNEAGSDHPASNIFRDTALDSHYDCNGIQRLICADFQKVNAVLTRSAIPASARDIVLVMVNDPQYGGSGGAVAIASTHALAVELILHEVGHTFALLADEYTTQPPPCSPVEPFEENATAETRRDFIKWAHWIDPATPIPTPGTALGIPGLYQGAKYCPTELYRPTYDSKMRSLGRPFEQINTEQHVLRIYNLMSPIDAVTPPTAVTSITQGQLLSVTPFRPLSHTLDSTWRVDGVVFATGPEFDTSGVPPGAHQITVTIKDSTPLVRSDVTGLLQGAVEWNVVVEPRPNSAPTISDLTDQTIGEDSSIGPLTVTVADLETPAASLTLSATSSNPALVPQPNIIFGGDGAARTLTIIPAAHANGTATINVSVSDGALTASASFVLTVTPVNDAPTISDLANQSISEDTVLGPVAVSVSDIESAAATLTVTAASSNPTLVPVSGLSLAGTGANRTITVAPAANQSGSATITLTVSDGALTASDTFVLTVNPVNDPPTVAVIPDKTIEQDETVAAFPLIIADIDSPEGSIVVAATSSNTTLLPASGIAVAGAGLSRTLGLAPAAGQAGSTIVSVTVSDSQVSTSTAFTLTVVPTSIPPSTPRNFLATLTGGTLLMTWDRPASGAPPTDYVLQVATDANFTVVVFDQPTGSVARSLTIPNVPNGIFHLRLRARNAFGIGPPSNVQRIGDPPDPPANFVATLSGTTLTMTWVPPASGPSVTDYVVEAALNGGFSPVIYSQATSVPVTSFAISGVPPGTVFLRLRARNGSRLSGPSNTQVIGAVTCTAAPAPATAFTISKLGGFNLRLGWTAPGGPDPATDYVVQAALDAGFPAVVFNQPIGSSATTFDAIAPPGMFFVRIVATNACGVAAPSNAVTLVMP